MKVIEKDLLWGELGLDSLLLDTGNSLDKEYVKSLPESKKKAVIKHQKMVKKPTYNAIMGRYNAAPHKPVVITKSKLDRLADPVLGKFTHVESRKYEDFLKSISSNEGSPSPRRVAKPPQRPEVHSDEKDRHASHDDENEDSVFALTAALHASPTKQHYGIRSPSKGTVHPLVEPFFMTEADDKLGTIPEVSHNQHVSPKDKVASNIRNSRNGFASAFRDQIRRADKVGKLAKPLRLDDQSRAFALRARREQREKREKLRAKDFPFQTKRGLRRNGAQDDSKGLKKASKVLSKDPLLDRLKNVKSSGYGALRGKIHPSAMQSSTVLSKRDKVKPLPNIPEARRPAMDRPHMKSSKSTPMFPANIGRQESRLVSKLRKVKSDADEMPSPGKSSPGKASPHRHSQPTPAVATNLNDGINDFTTAAFLQNPDPGSYTKKRSVARSVAALYHPATRAPHPIPPSSPGQPSSKPPLPLEKTSKGSSRDGSAHAQVESRQVVSRSSSTKAPVPKQSVSKAKSQSSFSSSSLAVPAMETLSLQDLHMIRPGQGDSVSVEEVTHHESSEAPSCAPLELTTDGDDGNANTKPLEQYDLDSMMEKMKKYEKRVSSASVKEVKVDNAAIYTKGDVEATFAKHALRLGSNINNAENILKKYSDFKNCLE